jgi:hypothetical protein
MLEREGEMEHTHLERWSCASGKWMISRHEWSPRYRIAHGWKIWVWICQQGTWELMKQKEPRSIYIYILLLFYFLLIFLSFSFFLLFPFFFFTFLFISSYYFFSFFMFFFCSSELLQHNTYISFVRDDVMTPPPCLNDARPRA